MSKTTQYIFFLIALFFINSCSFDKKTGIWSGYEKELKRVEELESENKIKIYSTESKFALEKNSKKNANLSKPTNNEEWKMSGQNLQNSIGNLYLKGIEIKFLKKKVGKDKFDIFQRIHPPLFLKNNLILTDDKGSIFKINKKGNVYWKTNIYKKIYKKLYKKLTFTIYQENIYVADNIGFIYAINYQNGQIVWKINFGIPLKSNIKVYKDRIFILDQNNRVLCLNIDDGSIIWNIAAIKTFIKSQNLLGLAFAKDGSLVILNSAGDLIKVDTSTGKIYWTMNSLSSLSSFASDFYKSSDVVIENNEIIFSSIASTYSINLLNGYVNWIAKVSSSGIPIISNDNVFLVTDRGYFVNLNRKNGEIIWSKNIFKSLKKRKRKTEISGFVMGSNKIYATTFNGYLIVASALNGEVERYYKIAKSINSTPIVSNGELYILTSSGKILGFR